MQVLTQVGGSILDISQVISILQSSTRETGLDARVVHGNEYTIDLRGKSELGERRP